MVSQKIESISLIFASNESATATSFVPLVPAAPANLVTSLKQTNLWNKMLIIYPFVGGNANSHKFNLKDPRDDNGAFRLQFSGGMTNSPFSFGQSLPLQMKANETKRFQIDSPSSYLGTIPGQHGGGLFSHSKPTIYDFTMKILF